MVGIARPATADEASLLSDVAHVLTIPHPARLRERQGALVDRFRLPRLLDALSVWLDRRRRFADVGAYPLRVMGGEAQELGAEALVDVFGVSSVEPGRLVRVTPLRPAGSVVTGAKFIEFGEQSDRASAPTVEYPARPRREARLFCQVAQRGVDVQPRAARH